MREIVTDWFYGRISKGAPIAFIQNMLAKNFLFFACLLQIVWNNSPVHDVVSMEITCGRIGINPIALVKNQRDSVHTESC
jgi:hypothetical protein